MGNYANLKKKKKTKQKKKAVGFSRGNEELRNILILSNPKEPCRSWDIYLFQNHIAAFIREVIFAFAYFTNQPLSF